MKRFFWVVAAITSLTSIIDIAQAAPCSVQSTLSKDGSYNLALTCDRTQLLNEVPALQASGGLNPDISQTQVNLMPNMIAETIMMEASPTNLENAFKNPDVKAVHYEIFFLVADDYGNMEKNQAVSFTMRRETANRINWGNFSSVQLQRIVKMHYSPWFSQRVREEMASIPH